MSIATIKDVATAAAVSIATVSRVINETDRVSEPLRQRVLAAMEELGYQPNAVAQGLRKQATQSVGVLLPRLTEPFFSTLAFAIETTLFAHDYRTLFCNTEEAPEKEDAYVKMLLRQHVDAVIYFPGEHSAPYIERLLAHDLPIVFAERSIPGFEVNRVLVTNYQGGYDGIQFLYSLGHTEIGVISASSLNHQPGNDRLHGVQQAFADLNLQSDVRIIGGLPDFETGYEAGLKMLRDPARPSAIFALTDSIAIGVLHAVEELGLRVPDDLSLLGFDNIPLATYVIPSLSTVGQPIAAVGETAAQILLRQIQEPGRTTETVTLQTELIVRKSTAPPVR